MKSFLDFLNEMSVEKAEAILELNPGWTEEEMIKSFRLLAQQSHPDKGGSLQRMKDLNDAKRSLKGKQSATSTSSAWDNIDKENAALKPIVQGEFDTKFKPIDFANYFGKVFNTEFFYESTHNFEKNKNMAGISYQFYNKDRTKVFDLSIHAMMYNVKRTKSMLGYSSNEDDISYELTVGAYAYVNRKKVKIMKRNYISTKHHNILTDPKIIFPKVKLVKKQTRKFSKRDMLSVVVKELKAKDSGNGTYFIPINTENHYIKVARMTFQRQAVWTLYGVSEFANRRFNDVKGYNIVSFNESDETAQIFKDLSQLNLLEIGARIVELKQKQKDKK